MLPPICERSMMSTRMSARSQARAQQPTRSRNPTAGRTPHVDAPVIRILNAHGRAKSPSPNENTTRNNTNEMRLKLSTASHLRAPDADLRQEHLAPGAISRLPHNNAPGINASAGGSLRMAHSSAASLYKASQTRRNSSYKSINYAARTRMRTAIENALYHRAVMLGLRSIRRPSREAENI